MRFLLVISLIFLSLSPMGCRRGKASRTPVFATPFGQVKKYSLRSDIMYVLGNPVSVKHKESLEIWRYSLGQGQDVFIYFRNGKLVEVKDGYGRSTLVEIE